MIFNNLVILNTEEKKLLPQKPKNETLLLNSNKDGDSIITVQINTKVNMDFGKMKKSI